MSDLNVLREINMMIKCCAPTQLLVCCLFGCAVDPLPETTNSMYEREKRLFSIDASYAVEYITYNERFSSKNGGASAESVKRIDINIADGEKLTVTVTSESDRNISGRLSMDSRIQMAMKSNTSGAMKILGESELLDWPLEHVLRIIQPSRLTLIDILSDESSESISAYEINKDKDSLILLKIYFTFSPEIFSEYAIDTSNGLLISAKELHPYGIIQTFEYENYINYDGYLLPSTVYIKQYFENEKISSAEYKLLKELR